MNFDREKESITRHWDQFFEHINEMERAWVDFMEFGKIPSPQLIAPDIVESWKESLERKLDPYHDNPVFLSKEETEAMLARSRELIEAATPLFEYFARQFSNQYCTLDLYSADLYLVRSFGYSSDLVQRQNYLREGLYRGEDVSGLTSMSLALRRKTAVQLVGSEHFSYVFRHHVCSCVPIMHEGQCVGLINVVERQWKIDTRTMGMVLALGKGVEYNLQQQKLNNSLQLSNSLNETILSSMADGILVTDQEGAVIKVNPTALRLLAVSQEELERKNVEDIFGQQNPISTVLRTGKSLSDQEVTLTMGERTQRFTGTVKPILSAGKTIGVMASIKGMSSARNIMKAVGGWNATFHFDDIVGDSPAFRQAVLLAEQTAMLDSNTLICGESGTGKELFAQSIHNDSAYRDGPFVAINCAAIPNGLLESEMFGYESGAYTGAKRSGQPGKMELAEGGTLFLDEVNSIPLDLQSKLLRALQEKRITRVGGTVNIPLRLKIIAACNSNLWDMVQNGLFRADLFYRLNVITIQIPALRQHPEDIPLLVDNVMRRLGESKGIPLTITAEAVVFLSQYHWPGNVRELENVVERAYVNATVRKSIEIDLQDVENMLEFAGRGKALTFAMPGGLQFHSGETDDDGGRRRLLRESEKTAIEDCLREHRGNISATAKALGMARNTLYQRIKKYEIRY